MSPGDFSAGSSFSSREELLEKNFLWAFYEQFGRNEDELWENEFLENKFQSSVMFDRDKNIL